MAVIEVVRLALGFSIPTFNIPQHWHISAWCVSEGREGAAQREIAEWEAMKG